MANMVADDWAGRYTRVVAGEVRRYREARKMSAQGLSDACASLGYPIHRSVLANFENGRRTNLNLAELLVIAKALDVEPIFLMFPLGYEPEIEVLPGETVSVADAVEWVAGDAGRRWIAGVAEMSSATLFQLRQFEALTMQEIYHAGELGLHHEGGYEAIAAEMAEARRRLSAYGLEGRALEAEVKRLEQAAERTSAAELIAARRQLADYEAKRQRRLEEEAEIGARFLTAEQWKRGGGLQPLAERLKKIQDEIVKRGMKPAVPFDALFQAVYEGDEQDES